MKDYFKEFGTFCCEIFHKVVGTKSAIAKSSLSTLYYQYERSNITLNKRKHLKIIFVNKQLLKCLTTIITVNH